MCLGIVGQVVSIEDAHPDLALVEVAGAQRKINIGILAGEGVAAGDWILIHAGFAMERIDAETAANQMTALRDYTGGPALDLADDPLEGAAPSAPAGPGGGTS
jgi:hydrogenase expression/formation protein HypC